MEKENLLMIAIQMLVASKLNRTFVTWEEVRELYASREYPEINKEIDRIIGE